MVKIQYLIETSIFAVNMTLKLFRVTIAYADIGSLKSLHTFLNKYLYNQDPRFQNPSAEPLLGIKGSI